MALDVGTKRIGVAKADSDTRIAVPVGFLLADGTEVTDVDANKPPSSLFISASSLNIFTLALPLFGNLGHVVCKVTGFVGGDGLCPLRLP